jgi:hypothetical protein
MTRDHHQPADHAAWSSPPDPGPWSGTTPATCPGRPAGAGEHLLRPMLPRHPAGTLALDQRPCRPGGQAALQPGRRPSDGPRLRRPSCEPGTANAAPSLPVRPDAGRRPRRPRATRARRLAAPNRGRPATRATPGSSAARTARRQRRGHRRPVRPDTWMRPGRLDTGRLDTGHVDAGRPLDRLDGRPHGGPDEADRAPTGLAGVRTSSRPATTRWPPDLARGRVTAPGGRSATQDGSAVTVPAPRP